MVFEQFFSKAAYLEQAIERDLFERRKSRILIEQKEVEEKLAELDKAKQSVPDRLAEFLELAGSAYLQYELGLLEQKRDLRQLIIREFRSGDLST